MAKTKKSQTKSDPESGDEVTTLEARKKVITTLKARNKTADVIRQIGVLLQIKQEDVLELFQEQFETHLLKLLDQRTAELKNGR